MPKKMAILHTCVYILRRRIVTPNCIFEQAKERAWSFGDRLETLKVVDRVLMRIAAAEFVAKSE